MILQIDSRWENPSMHDNGCHVLSECFLVNRIGNIPMSIDIIEAMILKLQGMTAPNGKPAIDTELTVNDPDAIVTYFGLHYTKYARLEGPLYICGHGEQELLHWSRPGVTVTHWTTGDGAGNVAYDPEGYSLSVSQGKMFEKKIFTMETGRIV